MACFEWNFHIQISGGDYPCEHYFLLALLLYSMIHYDITMGNDFARDVQCDVTMSNDCHVYIS